MKIILAFTLTVISITSSFSQSDEETVAPKNYLGELNGEQIYYTGLSHVRSNHIKLYTINNDVLSEAGEINLPDDRLEQIFLFKNQIYALTSDLNETNYFFLKLDARYQEVERIKIMSYGDQLELKNNPTLATTNHRVRIITHPGKALIHVVHRQARAAVIDFDLMKSQEYGLNILGEINIEPIDALFFDGTNAHVVYESRGVSFGTHPRYFTFIDGKVNYFGLNDYLQNGPGKATSFKFIQANDENYLVSLLYERVSQIGFTITKISDLNTSEIKLNKVINEKLDDPSLWSKKSYKQWKRNPPLTVGSWQLRLDEAHFIDNQLLLSVRTFMAGEPISNILVSSVNMADDEKPVVNWNVITHNGVYNNSSYYYNQFNHDYVLAKYQNHIRLFYNCDKKRINEEGEVIKKRKETNYQAKESSIAIIDIDLNNGASKFIVNPYTKSQGISTSTTSPYYSIIGNNIYIIEEVLNYHGPIVSTKERRYHYKPTLLIFPIDPGE